MSWTDSLRVELRMVAQPGLFLLGCGYRKGAIDRINEGTRTIGYWVQTRVSANNGALPAGG